MRVQISSAFDAGAIQVISIDPTGPIDHGSSRACVIKLNVRADSASAFAQWFHFRVTGVRGVACQFSFLNAAQCAYPEGWRNYRVVASYDLSDWFRVDTQFDGQTLSFAHRPERDVVWYAYFEPYSEARHHAFLGKLGALPGVTLSDLGHSVQGRALTCVTVSDAGASSVTESAPRDDVLRAQPLADEAGVVQPIAGAVARPIIWLIGRQHPGETMAEWFLEGLLERLLGMGQWAGDSLGARLRQRAVFKVVPNMNPDGAAAGNLRTNAAGANLNREWMAPDAARSPEVLAVREAIHQGCSMFFDVHGDEALPYVFAAGGEMLPGFDAQAAKEQGAFIEAFKRASADFQDVHGYPSGKYREEALKLASKYVGHRFGCLSLTLELPFKDNANRPDAVVGWNGARSAALGAAMLEAINEQLDAFFPPAASVT